MSIHLNHSHISILISSMHSILSLKLYKLLRARVAHCDSAPLHAWNNLPCASTWPEICQIPLLISINERELLPSFHKLHTLVIFSLCYWIFETEQFIIYAGSEIKPCIQSSEEYTFYRDVLNFLCTNFYYRAIISLFILFVSPPLVHFRST